MGGMANMAAAHPGWTGALTKAGTYGAQQGAGAMFPPPEPPPPQMPPPQLAQGQFSGMSQQNDELAQQQLARLRAYFSGAGQGMGGGFNV